MDETQHLYLVQYIRFNNTPQMSRRILWKGRGTLLNFLFHIQKPTSRKDGTILVSYVTPFYCLII